MQREESRYPADWFQIGDKELVRARNLFQLRDLDGAGFNIQQAVEKYLKGYLLSKGWQLRRIHELEPLLNEAVAHDSFLEQFRGACQRITDYYIEERYPFFVASNLTEEEIRESLTAAEKLITRIRGLVGWRSSDSVSP
ncbi:MAG: HEPN domain-containing protein [Planctomycetes bacterium]|nr:HEPN domain-containing protein [Planctomycetota bacterium]MBM4078073.1 HEPN domain-containing protein [Planctomycetota bacterium]MBM4083605.1 HEPN domain-containing protein [Planctomycetota bacterium]